MPGLSGWNPRSRHLLAVCCSVLQCFAVWCSVLQGVVVCAVCCSVLQWVTATIIVSCGLQCVAMRCGVYDLLQCAGNAVLQCVAVGHCVDTC